MNQTKTLVAFNQTHYNINLRAKGILNIHNLSTVFKHEA
jgi:hypothetical protein